MSANKYKNSQLCNAKVSKNNEFYTQLSDIEKELTNYKDFFADKVVYCNCDDARHSNFVKYFLQNFKELKLKKLISSGYKENGKGILFIYDGDDHQIDDISITEMNGDGDFRSEECISILESADVVVTNPPFSHFREYITQLIKYNKKFIVIGNGNAITYKEIFPYIKNDKIWLGNKSFSRGMDFILGDNFEESKCKYPKKEKDSIIVNIAMCIWFTNVPHDKRNTPIKLSKKYNERDYPKYDNYDAINISRVKDIPEDYEGVMGVPITFLDKYCPSQFEIIGGFNGYKKCDYENALICGSHTEYIDKKGNIRIWNGPIVNKKTTYYRILIKKRKINKC